MPPKKRSRAQQANDEKRKRQCVHQRGKRKISVVFDGRAIQNTIVRNIKREDTVYVVGCIAWLSSVLKTNCHPDSRRKFKIKRKYFKLLFLMVLIFYVFF